MPPTATQGLPARPLGGVLNAQSRSRSLFVDTAVITGASLLVALCAQVELRLPFTPVPVTGQTFGVLLIGALLGRRRGALALLLYLAEGAVGLPFFAGGTAGAIRLVGPTGGYLWSYPLAAAFVGWLSDRGWARRSYAVLAAMAMGDALILILGVGGLSRFMPGGLVAAWAAGAAPFLVGDAIKLSLAASLLPIGRAFVQRTVRPATDDSSSTANR